MNSQITFCCLLILTSLSSLIYPSVVEANELGHEVCPRQTLEASYELANFWIFICQNNQEKTLIKQSKNSATEPIVLPAFGTFPTYAAIEGEISDPESKIYNVSPFDFKLIQASIILNIDPVITTTHQETGTKLMVLSGEKAEEALNVCEQKKPVQVFETESDDIYVCIDSPEENINAIDLEYIQKSKNNTYPVIKLPANLVSSISYETVSNQDTKYIISYQGLEIYNNEQLSMTTPVINLYLALPDMTIEDGQSELKMEN